MADHTRPGPQRFFIRGLQLIPMDAIKPDHVGYLRNVRSYQEGTIGPRCGLTKLSSGADAPAHSPMCLNDGTSFATVAALRLLGAGTKLYGGPIGGAYVSLDTGFSGDPLSGVVATPLQSPQPWLYVTDRSRARKVSTASVVALDGIPQPSSPSAEPVVRLSTLQILPLEGNTSLATWAAVGTIAGATSAVGRVSTTVTSIVYDVGTTGPCTIVPADFSNIINGSYITISGPPDEDLIVAEIHPAVGSTTVAAVIFDVGTTGLCTIQPVTSLAVGQIETPTFDEAQRRYHPEAVHTPASPSTTRVVDFAVNSLVSINGATPVRVLSTAIGIDGVVSFRCNSPVTIAAGQTIAGVASFRSTTSVTHAAAATLLEIVLEQVLTAPNATDPAVGGAQLTAISGGTVDASQITLGPTPRATLPEDDIVLSFKASLLSYVNEVRFYLNVDAVNTDFLTNYYFHAWRGNDLITAVQSINAAVTQTIQQAKQNVATQQAIDQVIPAVFDPPGIDEGGKPFPGRAVSRAQVERTGPDGGRDRQGRPIVGTAVPRGGSDAIGLTATSRQLALGNNQWIQLRCKVRDLIRVGQDSTRTLQHINAVQILVQIQGTITPITVDYADFYLAGGFGPDARETLEPYSYCYRRRSSTTGARSNPSPPTRTGIVPRRQRVICQGTASTDPTVDLDDWFKRGGQLTGWTYFGTAPTGAAINDDAADSAIEGGEDLRLDLFQPWPIADKPKNGTCTVAGTAVLRTAGDTFATDWAPGTAIIVNGRTGTLYASPANSNLLFTTENLGSGSGLAFTVPEPIRLGQPLPVHWGGEVSGVIVRFACGDPTDPGALHWTHGNDPDATSDANWLYVTTAPLQNGGIYDGRPFVFSSDDLYVIVPTFGQITTYRAERSPCGRGLWSRWAMCIGRKGIYFLAKDGICRTTFGQAEEISSPDISVLFPAEGADGETIRGIAAPDMTAKTRLRLSYVDGLIYFDYKGIDGNNYTLIYDEERDGWWFDQYAASGIVAREAEKGAAVEDQILAAVNGYVYQYDSDKLIDDATAIGWDIWPGHVDGGDSRLMKQWGDAIVDGVPGEGYTVLPVYKNGRVALAGTAVAAGDQRVAAVVDLSAGAGVLSTNFGVRISGSVTLTDPPRPLLYLWEPSFVPKQVVLARRATDWDDLGYKGAKFIQGVVIRADTCDGQKAIEVQYEGGHVGVSLTLLHQGETTYAYPLQPAGWTPFVAELVRIIGVDQKPWLLYDWRWVWEPAPEAATQWQTQETTFDLPGFMHVRDAVIAYQAHCPITLTVWHDNGSQDYTLPTSNDLYLRYYQPLIAAKGKWVRFRLKANSPFRLFAKDTKVRVQGWGQPGGYMGTIPFGGPHRETGAAI